MQVSNFGIIMLNFSNSRRFRDDVDDDKAVLGAKDLSLLFPVDLPGFQVSQR